MPIMPSSRLSWHLRRLSSHNKILCAQPKPSPISKLPVELLSEIFMLATHGNPPSSFSNSEDVIEEQERIQPGVPTRDSVLMPAGLSSVNRHWRAVAKRLPALWTTFCVTVQDVIPKPTTPRCVSFLEEEPSVSLLVHEERILHALEMSKNHPIDIYIDARDHEWDFVEEDSESTSSHEELLDSSYILPTSDPYSYTHPFTSAHMSAIMALFLPHLHRWRSLAILTDTWAPMYTALMLLSQGPTISFPVHGSTSTTAKPPSPAPMLESITLMRCNEYTSYCHSFHPSALAEPVPLNFGVDLAELPQEGGILPRLRHLVLRGVHVHWESLAGILPPSSPSCSIATSSTERVPGLRSLDLSSHSPSVRPSTRELTSILSRCTSTLTHLDIHGSGVQPQNTSPSYLLPTTLIPSSISSSPSSSISSTSPTLASTSLSALRTLHLGFNHSAQETSDILALLDAPALATLGLEDATHPPAIPEDLENADVRCVLRALETNAPRDGLERGMFPRLEVLRLKDVHTCPSVWRDFLGGRVCAGLKRVEVVDSEGDVARMGMGCAWGGGGFLGGLLGDYPVRPETSGSFAAAGGDALDARDPVLPNLKEMLIRITGLSPRASGLEDSASMGMLDREPWDEKVERWNEGRMRCGLGRCVVALDVRINELDLDDNLDDVGFDLGWDMMDGEDGVA